MPQQTATTRSPRISKQARNWVSNCRGQKITPTIEMAYLAGWKAALKRQRDNIAAEMRGATEALAAVSE